MAARAAVSVRHVETLLPTGAVVTGSAILTGAGSAAAAGTSTTFGAATIVGTGTAVADGSVVGGPIFGAAALTATGTATVTVPFVAVPGTQSRIAILEHVITAAVATAEPATWATIREAAVTASTVTEAECVDLVASEALVTTAGRG
jgi:hypothetical protein